MNPCNCPDFRTGRWVCHFMGNGAKRPCLMPVYFVNVSHYGPPICFEHANCTDWEGATVIVEESN
jgi:hypothetical protein